MGHPGVALWAHSGPAGYGRWVWEALRRVSVLELNERMNTIMEGVCGVAVLVGVHRTVIRFRSDRSVAVGIRF